MVEVDKYKLKSENIFNQLSLARDLQNGINSLRDKLDEKNMQSTISKRKFLK